MKNNEIGLAKKIHEMLLNEIEKCAGGPPLLHTIQRKGSRIEVVLPNGTGYTIEVR